MQEPVEDPNLLVDVEMMLVRSQQADAGANNA
jgi:hypothetical protein